MGKYYCPACGMFFEFGMKKDQVTCPLMAQKCMFTPTHIENSNYKIEKLIKLYKINPDVFKRFLSVFKKDSDQAKTLLKNLLLDDWHLKASDNDLNKLWEYFGT